MEVIATKIANNTRLQESGRDVSEPHPVRAEAMYAFNCVRMFHAWLNKQWLAGRGHVPFVFGVVLNSALEQAIADLSCADLVAVSNLVSGSKLPYPNAVAVRKLGHWHFDHVPIVHPFQMGNLITHGQ